MTIIKRNERSKLYARNVANLHEHKNTLSTIHAQSNRCPQIQFSQYNGLIYMIIHIMLILLVIYSKKHLYVYIYLCIYIYIYIYI